VFRIARNLVRDDHDRRHRRRAELTPEASADTASVTPSPWLGLSLGEALEALEPDLREAFLLREVGGLGYTEIAAVCGATPDAVRNRIYRARRELKGRLARGGPLGRREAGEGA
jgi:RNA polymerase sigma-70 factor (ECF subfamily)